MKKLVHRYGFSKQMIAIAKLAALLVTITLISTACSSLQEENAIPLGNTSDTSHLITITPQAGDSAESLAEEYGGKVLAFKEGNFAIIGINSASDTTLSKLSLSGGNIEENTNAFSISSEAGIDSASSSLWAGGSSSLWAGGSSSLWAGGSSSLWAGGSSSLWAGGSFDWMPENTDIWKQIGLDAGHSESQNLGAGTIVAVIDTGVDYTHPALSDAIMPGWDFYDNDDDPFDEGVMFENRGTGHGTHIAGIIRQVAPRATILPIRILGTDGTGTIADLATAILWAEEQGADVINLSLGSVSYSSAVDAALKSVVEDGVMVVASAGNSGNQNVTYPAASMERRSGQISVTSVDSSDIKSSFANYSYDIEMSAPGEQIFGPAPGNLKVAWSGTSMSVPMVVGALALGASDDSVTNTTLTRRLYDSTHSINNLSGNQSFLGWWGSSKLGKGRLDINKFYQSF